MTSSATLSIAAIPDEVLTRALTFLDRRSLAAATLTRRRWSDIIWVEGSAPHWRALVAAEYPEVEAAMGNAALPLGGWWALLLLLQDGGFWRALLAVRYPSVETAALQGGHSPLALSDEISPMTDIDTREVAAFASACRGDGPATIWWAFLAPQLAAAAPPSADGGWRGLFLYTERLATLADARLKGGLAQLVEGVRNEVEPLGLDSNWGNNQGRPYPSPTEGTTATETPDASGVYSQPVYYDWGANWERVKELIPTPAVQEVLEGCVEEAADGYYFDSWDEERVWPFFFNGWRRCGNGEQDELMRRFLPSEHVQEMNGRYADWFRSRGEALLAEESTAGNLAGDWVAEALELGDDISEEGFARSIEVTLQEDVKERLYDCKYEEASGRELEASITTASEKLLYHKDSPLRETLLCTSGNSWAFLPLNYVLAELLSPEGTELKVYSNSEYCVVVDERRNIVFDNFWYFCGASASVALERSREYPVDIELQPIVSPFSIFQIEIRRESATSSPRSFHDVNN